MDGAAKDARTKRVLTLAPYLPCRGCENACRGWRPSEALGGMAAATSSTVCARCPHPADKHGDLEAFADEKLDALIAQLQQRLQAKRAEDKPVLTEQPPFESPVIVDLFRYYLLLAYGEAPLQPEQRQRLNELCNFFLAVLDANFLAHVPAQLLADASFAPLHQRWLKYCAKTEANPNPQHTLTRVFGRTMLIHVSPLLMATLRNAATPLPDALKEFAPKFLEAFVQEARNPRSPMFRTDALEVLAQRRASASSAEDALRRSSTELKREALPEARGDSSRAAKRLRESSGGGGGGVSGSGGAAEPLGRAAAVGVQGPDAGLINVDPMETPRWDVPKYPEGISFIVVRNDGQPESLVRLTDMKQIFHKQLPKMPKTYIARLVFDPEHRTLVCMLDSRSIGGITFRPFYEQGFVEITFCAVTTDRQVRGFGSLIMTHLKAYCQQEGLLDFLTYADAFAVGYFSKQGFRTKVTVAREAWTGRIKDYDGATLMHCVLHPSLNYVNLGQMLLHARKVTGERIAQRNGSAQVYKGLSQFKGKRKKERMEIADIPGVLEAGWLPGTEKEAKDADRLREELEVLVQQIKRHSYAWPFKEAVDKNAVPNYYKVITDPIDLSMIQERLDSGYYVSRDLLAADLRRMLTNCKTFNDASTSYHKCALALEAFIDEKFGLKEKP